VLYALAVAPARSLTLDCVGDILHVEVLGRHIIVCNSYKTANELLDKQAIFSGRPVLWMAGKLYVNDPFRRFCHLTANSLMPFQLNRMGWEKSITVQTYNDTWRKQRRILHPIMVCAKSKIHGTDLILFDPHRTRQDPGNFIL
jgi:hypothetical protein